MKYILIIIFTFILAFATSLLLELNFISKSNIRITLVALLILIELIGGAIVFYQFAKEEKIKI
jgi:hypothetical protein